MYISPKPMHEAIVVFTGKTKDRILEQGGTSSWTLQLSHARQCQYAVCTRNRKTNESGEDWTGGIGPEEHAAAFLVGRISGIVPAPKSDDAKGRWLIQFSEYAEVMLPKTWQGWRNPVRYTTLEEIGIDPTALDWKPMSPPSHPDSDSSEIGPSGPKPLTLAEAKRGLALTFGVPIEAIEITVRG